MVAFNVTVMLTLLSLMCVSACLVKCPPVLAPVIHVPGPTMKHIGQESKVNCAKFPTFDHFCSQNLQTVSAKNPYRGFFAKDLYRGFFEPHSPPDPLCYCTLRWKFLELLLVPPVIVIAFLVHTSITISDHVAAGFRVWTNLLHVTEIDCPKDGELAHCECHIWILFICDGC